MKRVKRKIELAIKNILGLPVEYDSTEFKKIKAALDWDTIPEQRIKVLTEVLLANPEEIEIYVKEAEAIHVDDESQGNGFEGVGSPMGRTDRLTLYAALRIIKPNTVVETGTAAGASSVYILSALAKNGFGILHSIDATKDRTNVGRLVPESLRSNYTLHAGDSLSVLNTIFTQNSSIDVFVHDSCHTYKHMMLEYKWARRHTTKKGILCSHDVLMGNVWPHFIKRYKIKRSGIVKNFGICSINNNSATG